MIWLCPYQQHTCTQDFTELFCPLDKGLREQVGKCPEYKEVPKGTLYFWVFLCRYGESRGGWVGFVVLSSLPQGVRTLGNLRGSEACHCPAVAVSWSPGETAPQSELPLRPHLAPNSKLLSTQSLRQDHLTSQLLLKTSWQLPGWKPSGTK